MTRQPLPRTPIPTSANPMPNPTPSPDRTTSHLQRDGSVFPPVTPDPPAPPGYVSPLDNAPALDDLLRPTGDAAEEDDSG